MKHLADLQVLILGLGASGLAMARWCARHGAHVTVADTREAPPQLATLAAELPQVRFVGGPLTAALVEGQPVRAVYRSPGLAPATIAPVVDAARAIGLPVGGELDLFAQALSDLRVAPDAAPDEDDAAADAAHDVPGDAAAGAIAVAAPPADAAEAGADIAVEPSGDGDGEAAAPAVPSDDAAADDETLDETPPPLPIAPPPVPEPGYRPAVLAITGTNGKTTVTSLTGQLVERAGKTVAVAGNIGPSLLDTLSERMDADALPQVWVLELSSFQLDGVQGFEPTAAAVLNVTQDHLDWHGGMEAYAAAKARIFGRTGLMVLNRDDVRVMGMLPAPVKVRLQRPQLRAHVTFGADLPQRPGDFGIERANGLAWLVRAHEADETLKRRRGAAVQEEIHLQRLMPADALRIRGQHNALNALAALALASAAGCALAPMLYGLREYRGEPHRVEPIAIVDEVEYFDDSKGTNVGATAAALSGLGLERKLVVILGGDGKGQDFSPLAPLVRQYVRAVVLIGRDGPAVGEALAETGVPLLAAATLPEAVGLCADQAQPGDAVLLSPACASLDMFRDYAHRADVFREAVDALADEEAYE
ncbi:UDP-N-acetylmuramoylalanine--D-glutamate ligase [Pseudacidovorax intermedius]|uniref:UDP-N-acetylmuramoylalanine--D-glutamate ligase n=1 Tax=Pseudacidovorax intermedius TaxID=433924 RepID=A0A370FMG0_9BURK|nr:UDP-N-acetylmuramoyl-L-alanine--D-glutamate ligase [Pseudacidovorax intermedius]RDI28345.1 UDP-N-acetylmuramoylalanine--D-glutamate ligase [Pseudacidovorax intermedius]